MVSSSVCRAKILGIQVFFSNLKCLFSVKYDSRMKVIYQQRMRDTRLWSSNSHWTRHYYHLCLFVRLFVVCLFGSLLVSCRLVVCIIPSLKADISVLFPGWQFKRDCQGIYTFYLSQVFLVYDLIFEHPSISRVLVKNLAASEKNAW